MYRVICAFNDLRDDGRLYPIGAEYPAKGIQPTEDRIAELLSSNNKLGKPLIEKVAPVGIDEETDNEEIRPARKKRGRKNEHD